MKQMRTRLQRLERSCPVAVIPAGEHRLAEQVQCAWTDRFAAYSPANAELIREARERAAKYRPHMGRFNGPPLHAAQLSLSLHMQSTMHPCRDVPDWKRARELDALLMDAAAAYQRSARDMYPLIEADILSESMQWLALPPDQRRPVPASECRDEFWRLLTEPDYVHPHLRDPPEPSPWRTTSPSPTTATALRSTQRSPRTSRTGTRR